MKIWMLILASFLGLAFQGPAAVAADLYRWVDAEGKVHYSDQPPPATVKKVERLNFSNKPGEEGLPFALQGPVMNFPVTLFVSDCGPGCDRARALLRKRGVPHAEKRIEEPGVREELRALSGGELFVPFLTVGRTKLAGFTEDGWNQALDLAGYPANALIQLPPPKPAPTPPAPEPEAQTEEVPEEEAQEVPEAE